MLTLNEALKYAGIKPATEEQKTVEEAKQPEVQDDARDAINEARKVAGLKPLEESKG